MAKKKQTPQEETAETVETPEAAVEAEAVNPWEEKYNQEHDAHLRLAAEYDNFRKRTIKEKELSYANGKSDAVETSARKRYRHARQSNRKRIRIRFFDRFIFHFFSFKY